MSLELNIDGKMMQVPGTDEISKALSAIDPKIRGISTISLKRDARKLTAFGHPKEGYTIEMNECLDLKCSRYARKTTSLETPIPHGEITSLFQAFAEGDSSWEGRFQWHDLKAASPRLARITTLIIAAILLYLVLRYVLKLI